MRWRSRQLVLRPQSCGSGLPDQVQQPGRYDITIPQRADFRLRLRLSTAPDGNPASAKVPIDAEGYEIAAQCWSGDRSTLYGSFTVEWIERAEGLFELVMTAAETALITQDCQWDLLVIEPSGSRSYWLEGRATLNSGLSSPLPLQ